MGVINHTSNIIESETGVNPVKDYIYQGNEDAYNEDTALIDSVNMFSALNGISSLSAQSNRFAQSVTQNKQKAKAVEAEAENVTEYNSRIIEAQEENFRPGRESVTAVQEASQSASTAVEKSNLNYGSISSHNEYKISKASDPKVKLAVGADGNLEGAKTPVVRGGATGSGESAAYKGGSNYSNLKDSKSVGAGKRFTPAQKKKIIQQNMERNGGVIKSDMSGEILVPATKSQKGVTPNPLEVQIDHIEPRSKGGTNSYSNAQVLSRYENIKKSDK